MHLVTALSWSPKHMTSHFFRTWKKDICWTSNSQYHFQLFILHISLSRDYWLLCLPLWEQKSSAVVIFRMAFLLKAVSCQPEGQWFPNTGLLSLCWGSTDPESRSLFPRLCKLLQLVNILLPRKPQPSLCTIWLKHLRSSEGWQKAGKKGECFTPTYQGSCFVYLCGLITPW